MRPFEKWPAKISMENFADAGGELAVVRPAEITIKKTLLGEIQWDEVAPGRAWLELFVFSNDLACFQLGQRISVQGHKGKEGLISFISPLAEHEKAATIRADLENPDGSLRPETYVKAIVTIKKFIAKNAVDANALQYIEGESVVFVPVEGGFEARKIQAGESDGRWTEILAGIEAGSQYVAKGGLILKERLQNSKKRQS